MRFMRVGSLRTGTVRNTSKEPGPNEPCDCGSGKKFKKCHGGTNVIPIIGGKKQQELSDEQQAAVARVQRTTGAVMAVLTCGTTSFQEGFDVLDSADGNLLAGVYEKEAEVVEFLDKRRETILKVWRMSRQNGQKPAEQH